MFTILKSICQLIRLKIIYPKIAPSRGQLLVGKRTIQAYFEDAIHTIYSRNNMGQKCEGSRVLWVLNEIIYKKYPENLKKLWKPFGSYLLNSIANPALFEWKWALLAMISAIGGVPSSYFFFGIKPIGLSR